MSSRPTGTRCDRRPDARQVSREHAARPGCTVVGSSCTVRAARLSDVDEIRAVQAQSVNGLCAGEYTSEQLAAWSSLEASHYRTRLASRGCVFLVADTPDGIAGFAAYLGGELLSLYVRPRWAGQGIGSRLLATVERTVADRQLHTLRLNSSLTAVEFYRRRGYRELGPGVFAMPNGAAIACVRMMKRLAEPEVEREHGSDDSGGA